MYSVVINRKIKPLPPPPKIGDTLNKITSAVIDSMNNVDLKIAVYPHKLGFRINNDIEDGFTNIKKLEIEYFNSSVNVKLSELYGRSSLAFTILSDTIIDSQSIFRKYDGFLKISDIKYNRRKTQALLIAHYGVARLSSSTVLYYLKEEKGKWIIVDSNTLSVS